MINEEVQRRVCNYYMEMTMNEDEYNALVDALVDKIWKTDERATDDELVKLGIAVIDGILAKRENSNRV